jgi:hypothetical protein
MKSFQGDKRVSGKYYTQKTSASALWSQYTTECSKARQVHYGSAQLLHTVFLEHTEIKQVGPTGHDVCDNCSALNLAKSKLAGLSDATSRAEHAKAVARIARTTPSIPPSASTTTRLRIGLVLFRTRSPA